MFGTVKDSGITAIDVEAFCVMLPEFQGEKNFSFKAGLFLSALINSSKESRFIVHTRHLAEPIDVLGYKNTKDIVVNGNAGHGIGIMMESGTIVVNGNVGECLGDRMSGGSITVNGDSGIYTGDRMEGGELRVNGSIDDLSPLFRGGNVFENGRPYLS
jgi:formylmethanofuran dehydrogenase subunit C